MSINIDIIDKEFKEYVKKDDSLHEMEMQITAGLAELEGML